MGLDHNYDDIAAARRDATERFQEEVEFPLARFVNTRFGLYATSRYLREGGKDFSENKDISPNRMRGPGSLRRQSGRLGQALRSNFKGGSREARVDLAVTAQGIVWTKEIMVEYAALHEFGGSYKVPVTERMRAYFWRRYYEAGGAGAGSGPAAGRQMNKWKGLALGAESNSHFRIEMPERPYARPSMEDVHPEAAEKGEELLTTFLDGID